MNPDASYVRTPAVALITGVTGQDGNYLAELLADVGVTVHGAVRPGGADGDDLPAGVHPHVVDPTDPGALAGLVAEVTPDWVFHLAAMSSVAASWADPVAATTANALSTAALLDACWKTQEARGRKITMVNASSSEIFAGSTAPPGDPSGTLPDTVQNEDTPIRPVSPYGASKAFGHTLCQAYRARGLEASNAVLYSHESPRRPETFVSRKITRAAVAIAAGRADTVTLGNLAIRRDWGWAPDYVEAMYRMAVHGKGEDFVVATGVAHSLLEFVAAAFAAVGIPDWQAHVRTDPALLRPVDAGAAVGDASRARETLGWTPTRSFEQIVLAMVDSDQRQEHIA